MSRVALMPCICCRLLERKQEHATNVHHIRANREARNDWLTLPLCWACHQGPHGVHGDQTYLRMLKMSEWALLAQVLQDLWSPE